LINPELFADLQPDGKQRRATNRNEALRDCLSDGVQTSTMSGGQQECFHSTLPGFVVLGSRFCVIRKRRSKYPEFTRILIAINKWIVDNNLRSLRVEPEGHFANARCLHGVANGRLMFGFAIQQEKTPSAGTGDLTSQGAIAGG